MKDTTRSAAWNQGPRGCESSNHHHRWLHRTPYSDDDDEETVAADVDADDADADDDVDDDDDVDGSSSSLSGASAQGPYGANSNA